MNRTGKIARLPYNIRQELNRRLRDNEPGDPLLAWLNARPEVQAVLRDQFDGNPITKQNLSEWHTGGFVVWELRQDIFGDALEAEEFSEELDAVTNSSLVDKLFTLLAGRYASLLVHWNGEVTPAFTLKLRALHSLCRDLTVLRREARGTGREEANSKPQRASGVATARGHREPETGKVEGRVKNEELDKTPGPSGPSKSVAPGRTTFPSDLVTSALADVATSCRHPETPGKPLPGMPNSILSNALKAAREKMVSGQPVLAVLPDWIEAALGAQPAVSLGKK